MPFQKTENRTGLARVEGKEFFLSTTLTGSSNPKKYTLTTSATKTTVLTDFKLVPNLAANAIVSLYEGIADEGVGTGSAITTYNSNRTQWSPDARLSENGYVSSSNSSGSLLWKNMFNATTQPEIELTLKKNTKYMFDVLADSAPTYWGLKINWLEL